MGDAAPGDVGDMQQAVHAAQIHEGAVIGDVLDHAFDHLLFLQAGDQRGALLGAALFQHGAARHHDVAAAAVHFQDLERLRLVHQRADIAGGTHIDLAARQEGHGAVEIDGEAALDAAEDHAGDAGLVVEGLLQLDPAFLAAGLVARQHGFAQRILDALEIDLDLVADLHIGGHARHGEFLQRHAAFGLQADIDHGEVVLDGDDLALDDGAFLGRLGHEALLRAWPRNRRGWGRQWNSRCGESWSGLRRGPFNILQVTVMPNGHSPLDLAADAHAAHGRLVVGEVSGWLESRRASLAPVAVLERALDLG